MADLKVTVDYSQLTGLIKTADQTKRTLTLMGQSLAQSGDMSAYMRGINQVVEAQKKLPAAARMSRSEIMKLGQEMKQQAQFAIALSNAAQQAAVQMQGVGKQSNRAGVLFQQAGYQIGDFIVQVQSGTDVMVAMGQQMTQLVGVGAMLSRSTKWIAAFSALGIIVPLATALAGAFLRMRKEADDSNEVLLKTADALKKVREETTDAAQALALLKSGFETIGELSLDAQIKSLETQLAEIESRKAAIKASVISEAAVAGTITTEELDKLLEEGYEKNTKELEDQAAVLREQLAIKIATRNELRAEEARIEAINLFYENQAKLEEEIAERKRQVARIQRERDEKEKAILDSYNQQLFVLEKQNEIEIARRDYGEDSKRFRGLEKQILLEILDEELKRLGYSEEQREAIKDQEGLAINLANQIKDQAEAAKTLADNLKAASDAMKSLSDFGNTLDEALAVSQAKVEALKTGADPSLAGQIASYKIGIERRTAEAAKAAIIAGLSPEAATQAGFAQMELLNLLETFEKERIALEASKRGGADKETAEERLTSLLRTAELERDLVGVEGERATQLRRAFDLTEQISQMEGGLTEERMKSIQTIVDLEAKTRLLQEAEEKRKAQIDEIVGHIRSAFDSLIDGTETVEEAFRKMMYNIARSIWEQQVMDPLANAATKWIGSLFQANGGVWNNGVQMFANGGVVNSPTPFRHAGGMGIMGEAGAEAIMPLKRGPDGKLGVAGGGGVVIHQNFNFAANGDESVKRIIAQEAPKIANMTQSQIMDARRRGGAMRNTFG